ncbi:MAG: pyridoxal 5'-phosphate synthase lyase subunit PdxS [Candidatus Thermoplasmatota archaeon]|nr:pyridoxal 5'-phosphate synthase lyase subunit PdxS [Candidatus Thermoplasmatota archaeon]
MPLNLDLEGLMYGTELVKRGFAKMQKGGVIMDVTTPKQAITAEEAGAVAVMALERVPADIRATGGVARMADPKIICDIMDAVSIPVMAKCRIGHIAEARILENIGVDMIDESEVLTPADPFHHIWKHDFETPFVCGARDLGEALRRINEGAATIRTKGEAGTGNVIEAVRHRRVIFNQITELKEKDDNELEEVARKIEAPFDLVKETAKRQRLPVVDFAAGGIATPADAALMMQLGNDGVFVGSGIFKSTNPSKMAKAIVDAVAHFDDASILTEISRGLGKAMMGMTIEEIPQGERMQERGW